MTGAYALEGGRSRTRRLDVLACVLAEQAELAFPVLSDAANTVAPSCGIVFSLDAGDRRRLSLACRPEDGSRHCVPTSQLSRPRRQSGRPRFDECRASQATLRGERPAPISKSRCRFASPTQTGNARVPCTSRLRRRARGPS
jgi:hypothetical protein